MPYYGIWVIRTNDLDYTPKFTLGRAHTMHRKGTAVFEVR